MTSHARLLSTLTTKQIDDLIGTAKFAVQKFQRYSEARIALALRLGEAALLDTSDDAVMFAYRHLETRILELNDAITAIEESTPRIETPAPSGVENLQ